MPKRFYSLDILRGCAALSIVIYHWPHFFYNGTTAENFSQDAMPLASIFFLIYKHGLYAVYLFFCLSGFIFFWLYARKIHCRKVSAWNFFVLRFSRLYPLHLATLVFVLIAQRTHYLIQGKYFVYPIHDSYHLILNLFFVSSWGLEHGFSYNAPIWSVSVEVFLYAIFFILCLCKGDRYWMLFLFALGGYFYIPQYWPIGKGLLFFFSGGLTLKLYQQIVEKKWIKKLKPPLLVLSCIMWMLTILEAKFSFLNAGNFFLLPGRLFLFSVTILSLAVWETKKGALGEKISVIGDLSYSSYLLHFPLQFIFLIVVKMLGGNHLFFQQKISLLIFFTILIPLCLVSHHYFEMPAQQFLRKNFLRRKQKKIPEAQIR